MLHLTNGDATRIRETGLPGDVLPWRDVLHEGPVPAGLDFERLSAQRVRFIAGRGWDDLATVERGFAERDARISSSTDEDEVVLWFEHDLYDQLQLIQILDWYAEAPRRPARFTLICIDRFPGVAPFHGLGQLEPRQLAGLFPARSQITAGQLDLARRAWRAFRAPSPASLMRLADVDQAELPFLAPAIRRLLQEFPGRGDGLSRIERELLSAVDGELTLGRLFGSVQRSESAPYLGDLVFATEYVNVLAAGAEPLIRLSGGAAHHTRVPGNHQDAYWRRVPVTTNLGRAVLAGDRDRVRVCGIDRWLGGVRLSGTRAPWRWDVQSQRLVERDT
jgi:hypothetical protein